MLKSGLAAVSIAIAALAALSAPGGASAQGWLWLDNSPATEFSEGDWALLRATIQSVLDDEPDGSTRAWASSQTGSGGDLTPVRTWRNGDQTCRQLRMVLRGRRPQSTSSHRMCKQPDGTWKFAP